MQILIVTVFIVVIVCNIMGLMKRKFKKNTANDMLDEIERSGIRLKEQGMRVTECMEKLKRNVYSDDAKKEMIIYVLQQLQEESYTYDKLAHRYNDDRRKASQALNEFAIAQNKYGGGANDLSANAYYKSSERFYRIDDFQAPYVDQAIITMAKEKIAKM